MDYTRFDQEEGNRRSAFSRERGELSFNPIQTGGGGRILPARTLDVYDYFNKKANWAF